MAAPSDFAHGRWIGGGTGAGTSTVARLPARRYGAAVYDGARAGTGHFQHADQTRYPYLAAPLRIA